MKYRHKKRKAVRKAPGKTPPNPLRVDPSRTSGLRRELGAELARRFARLSLELVRVVEGEDAFGLTPASHDPFTANVFCPTGKGGGVDPTCSPSGGRPAAQGDDRRTVEEFVSATLGFGPGATYHVGPVGRYTGLYPDDPPLPATGFRVRVEHPDVMEASYYFGTDDTGKKFVKVEIIRLNPSLVGQGRGGRLFEHQVGALSKAGYDYVSLHAAGTGRHLSTGDPGAMNGFYTWPRLGFDQSLVELAREYPTAVRKAREKFPGAATVLDVFSSKEGREWWKRNGVDLQDARFDLGDGSRSMRIHKAYLQEKTSTRGRVGETQNQTYPQTTTTPWTGPGSVWTLVGNAGLLSKIGKLFGSGPTSTATTGPNCGTGAGGFKPGNTCGRGGDGTTEAPPARAADPTQRPEFKVWFGASKVVDKAGNPKETAEADLVTSRTGKPLVVYHGNPRGEVTEFRKEWTAKRPESLHFGPGFYFTEDVEAARQYAHGATGSKVTGGNPAVGHYYLRAERPFDADRDTLDPSRLNPTDRAGVRAAMVSKAFSEDGRSAAREVGERFDSGQVRLKYTELTSTAGVGGYGASKVGVQRLLQEMGHDAITVQGPDAEGGTKGGNRFWVVFEPTQVKSTRARNFDPTSPDTLNTRWKLQPPPDKVAAFRAWLQANVAQVLLSKDVGDLLARYALTAYSKGMSRAYDDVKRKAGRQQADQPVAGDAKQQFLKGAFSRPEANDKVRGLAARSFTDLQGVTAAMSAGMARVLSDGLARGDGPRTVARALVKEVDGIGKARALTIARTEIVRAHAEGQLDAMEQMGVTEVGAAVEWDTTRDGRVCPRCKPLQGIVLKINEARGMLPRHPLCRCSWLPSGVGEDAAGRKRTQAAIQKAVRASVKASKTKKGTTDDWGPGARITKKRPTTNTAPVTDRLPPLDRDPLLAAFSALVTE